MKIIVTGTAGFIGMHVAKSLLERGDEILGIDSINNYYDISLKKDRLKQLSNYKNFLFKKTNIENNVDMKYIFKSFQPEKVIHLAAQAGVRYSMINPHAYIDNNISGFINILEMSQIYNIKHLVYASSSSVYGQNKDVPFLEESNTDKPMSLYGATKKANELMAHSYSSIYKLPTTGARLFTVYGPWGRPDMAPMLFTKAIKSNNKIDVFNDGNMIRDFTYIDDIVEGLIKLNDKIPTMQSEQEIPHKIFNLGNSKPVKLNDFIKILEKNLGIKAKKNFVEIQKGDVISTQADTSKLKKWINFTPSTNLEKGLKLFIEWYLKYYN